MDNLCLGTVQLGLNYGISNQTGKPDFSEVIRIIKSAFDSGIKYFDTAQAYGDSELTLGNAFKKLGVGDRVKVVSKLPPDYSHGSILELKDSLEISLKNLQVDSLWGLMAHRSESIQDWKIFSTHIKEVSETQPVKNIGASIYSPEEALSLAQNDYIDIIQVPLNVLDNRLLKNGFFDVAAANKKKVFIRSIFLQGLLLMSDEELADKKMGWVLESLAIYRAFLKKHKLAPQHFAISAIKQKFPNTVIITGVEHHTQLLENIQLFQSTEIDSKILDAWWSKLPDMPERLLNPSKWGS